MASSSRSSSSNCPPSFRRFCLHKIPAEFNTSHSHKNPERRYSCRGYKNTPNNCQFWEWHDEPLNEYYKLCFLRLYAERENAWRNQGFNHGRPEFEVEEDNNGEGVAEMNTSDLSPPNSKNSTRKNLEYQIRILYVAFVVVLLMLVVYKG